MKIFNRKNLISTSLIAILIGVTVLAGCSTINGNKSSKVPANQVKNSDKSDTVTGKDTDGDGIPDEAEKLLGTNPYAADSNGDGVSDKLDKNPNYTPNPIKETKTVILPVKIKDIRVQDNVNATDHLEITLSNTGKVDLKNFDCYFTEVDAVTKAKEGYYVKLTGFTLETGSTKTLHFDNKSAELHYNGNMNGIYGTSKNEVVFTGQIHATDYAPLDFSAKKDKGTAEVAD